MCVWTFNNLYFVGNGDGGKREGGSKSYLPKFCFKSEEGSILSQADDWQQQGVGSWYVLVQMCRKIDSRAVTRPPTG